MLDDACMHGYGVSWVKGWCAIPMCLLISVMLAGKLLLQTGHCSGPFGSPAWATFCVFLGERRTLCALKRACASEAGDRSTSLAGAVSCSVLTLLSCFKPSTASSILTSTSSSSLLAGKIGFLFLCLALPDLQLCGLPMMSCKLACPRSMLGCTHAKRLPDSLKSI